MSNNFLRKLFLILVVVFLMAGSYLVGTAKSSIRSLSEMQASKDGIVNRILSPNKEREILVKKDKLSGKISLIVADADDKSQIDLMDVYSLGDIKSDNWNYSGKYFYVKMTGNLGDDVYIFKGSGESFSTGQKFMDAFKLGFPQNQQITEVYWVAAEGLDVLEPALKISAFPTASIKNFYFYADSHKVSPILNLLPRD